MVNRALREQEIGVIIQTRSFIRDLHKQIEQLYIPPLSKFILYRGQGLSFGDLEQLRMLKGGLYSFHHFLSTSIDRNVALSFALSSRDNPNLIGVIFHINIDPASPQSALFASVNQESYYRNIEHEILFTTHTVFRVGETKQLEGQLWQVELSLTSDDDKDLKKLTENIRKATQRSRGWNRLAELLLKTGSFGRPEEVLQVIIENLTETDMKKCGHRYHLTGLLKQCKNNYDEALTFFHTALNIYQKFPDLNHLNLATINNDIGSIHQHKKEYSKALECHQMAQSIQETCEPQNFSDLAITYGNLAQVHKNMKNYSEALQFYDKKLDIHKTAVPLPYLHLATTFQNIAEMHYTMQDYPEASKLFQRVLRIQQTCISTNYADTTSVHNNIDQTHEQIGDHLKALQHYNIALNALQKSCPTDVSKLAIINNNIAQVYKDMKEFEKALEFYRATLRILDRYPHLEQPDLPSTHDNIGQMHQNMNEYKEAQLSYRQAINIVQQTSPQNYSQLQLYQEHLAKVPKKFF